MKNTIGHSSAKTVIDPQPASRLPATFNEMDVVADMRYRRDKSTMILSWRGYQCYHSQCRLSVINPSHAAQI